jgi:hypothetical protein
MWGAYVLPIFLCVKMNIIDMRGVHPSRSRIFLALEKNLAGGVREGQAREAYASPHISGPSTWNALKCMSR